MAVNQSQQIRAAKKQLRKIEKELAELGYEEHELSPRVRLNIDFARANVKSLIYDQAVLEGVSTTFPQTETILENGIVNGVKASDVQKILNLKHAWEFIVDPDVVASSCNYYLISHIARLVNEGFYENGGAVRSVPVTIGGSSYVPPIPNELDVKESIDRIIQSEFDDIDIAVELTLYCMKTQIFIDGNKRASIIFANHFMIQKGLGLLVVPENIVPEFKSLLVAYYEGRDEATIKQFLKEKCWRKF
jgi:prophage maintenance system killer protein